MKAQNTLNNNNNSKKRITKKRANKRKRRGSDSISNGNIKVGKKHRTTRNTRKKLVGGVGEDGKRIRPADVIPGSKTKQQSSTSLSHAPPLVRNRVRPYGNIQNTPIGAQGKNAKPDASGADKTYFSNLLNNSEKEFNELLKEINKLDDKYKKIEPIEIAEEVAKISLGVIDKLLSDNPTGDKYNKNTIKTTIDRNVTTTFIQDNEKLVDKILKFLDKKYNPQHYKTKQNAKINMFINHLDGTYKGDHATLLNKLVSFAKDTYNEGEASVAAKRKNIKEKFRTSAAAAVAAKKADDAAEEQREAEAAKLAEEERQRLEAAAEEAKKAAEEQKAAEAAKLAEEQKAAEAAAEEERQRLEKERLEAEAAEEAKKVEIINSLTKKAAELTEKAKLLNEKAQLLTGNAEAAEAAANEADKAIAAANEAADKNIVKTDINTLNAKLEEAKKADDAAKAAIAAADAALAEAEAAKAKQESAAGTGTQEEAAGADAADAADPNDVNLVVGPANEAADKVASKLKELKDRLQKANDELPKINNGEQVDNNVKQEVTAVETALTKAKAAVAAAETEETEDNVAAANTAVAAAETAVELAKLMLEAAEAELEKIKEKANELLKSEKYNNLDDNKKAEIATIKTKLDEAVIVRDAADALADIITIIESASKAEPEAGAVPNAQEAVSAPSGPSDELNKIYTDEEKSTIKNTTKNLEIQIKKLFDDIIVKKQNEGNSQIIELLNKAFEKATDANEKFKLASKIFNTEINKYKSDQIIKFRIKINNDYTRIDYLNKIAEALIKSAYKDLSVVDELAELEKNETPETSAKVAEASKAAEEAEKNVANIEKKYNTYVLKKDASELSVKDIIKKEKQAKNKAERKAAKEAKEAAKIAEKEAKILAQQQAQQAQLLAQAQAQRRFLEQQQLAQAQLLAQAQQPAQKQLFYQQAQPAQAQADTMQPAQADLITPPDESLQQLVHHDNTAPAPAQQKIDDTLGVTTSTTTKPGPGFNEVHIVVRVPHQYSTNVTGELSTTAATNLADLASSASKTGAELGKKIGNKTGEAGSGEGSEDAGLGQGSGDVTQVDESVVYGPPTQQLVDESQAALAAQQTEQAALGEPGAGEPEAAAQQQATQQTRDLATDITDPYGQQLAEAQLAQVQAAPADGQLATDGIPGEPASADGPQAALEGASTEVPPDGQLTDGQQPPASTDQQAASTDGQLAAQQPNTALTEQQADGQQVAVGGKLKIPKNGITPKRGRKQQSSILRRKTIPKRKRSKK